MNQRYKTLKRARQLNDPLLYDDYRRLRNKVSTMTKKKPKPITTPIYSLK